METQLAAAVQRQHARAAEIRARIAAACKYSEQLELLMEHAATSAKWLHEQQASTTGAGMYLPCNPQSIDWTIPLAKPTSTGIDTKKKAKGSSSLTPQYGRREDGTFVQLVCPACHRENFRGIMGFLNHCLHKHGIKYKNEAAALTSTAATPVPESKVPLDDRCRRVKRRHVQSNTVDSLTRAVRRRKAEADARARAAQGKGTL